MKKTKDIHFKGATSEVNNAPAGHAELVKNARKNLKKPPRNKFYCRVFYEGSTKEQFQLRSPKKESVKKMQVAYSKQYSDRILIFSEIKPIKVK